MANTHTDAVEDTWDRVLKDGLKNGIRTIATVLTEYRQSRDLLAGREEYVISLIDQLEKSKPNTDDKYKKLDEYYDACMDNTRHIDKCEEYSDEEIKRFTEIMEKYETTDMFKSLKIERPQSDDDFGKLGEILGPMETVYEEEIEREDNIKRKMIQLLTVLAEHQR